MTELSTDRRFHNLTQEQVQTLDQVLTEVIPIHGRGNFPTLEVKPKDIIHVVKDRLVKREIKVRDVRLNGSTASHVLVKENGTSYKDLDIIFGVELPRQEDFQVIKEVVLGCLLDFLPQGVNKDKITVLTMKEAYVQKMVKVFNEHDRWSLISLSNNRGKNVELKFVNSLRRQFEFSVDSFQIVLDRMLESYLEAERRQAAQCQELGGEASSSKSSEQLAANEAPLPTSHDLEKPPDQVLDLPINAQDVPSVDESLGDTEEVVLRKDDLPQTMGAAAETGEAGEVVEMKELEQEPEPLVSAEVELEPEVKAELEVLPVSEELTDASVLEKHTHVEASPEIENSQSSETEVHMDCSSPEAKDITTESIPSIENSVITEPVRLKVPCEYPSQPCTTFIGKTQNSHLEHPLPPPAKKTCKKSQMVVLKHSSPKPPRKMSKKVSNTPVSPEKTASANEYPVHTNHLIDSAKMVSKAQPNRSVQDEPLDPITDNQDNKTSKSLDKECQVQLLDVPILAHSGLSKQESSAAHDTESQAESMCSQNPHPKPETPREEAIPQKSEPECEEKSQEPSTQEPKLAARTVDPQHRETSSSHATEAGTPPKEPPAITVVAESMYGDFEQAMDHLRYRLIATRNPEEIRGGGLLKYSNLLVREFKPASETEIKTLERYMCSRFFIDFPDVHEQQRKIESYLRNHFIGEESSKYDYLMTLRRVVNESTVCLMGHERRQTLNMITVLALKVLGEQNAIPNTTNVTCFYQPAPYMADHNFSNYYIAHSQPPLIYHPYPLHIHMQTGLV